MSPFRDDHEATRVRLDAVERELEATRAERDALHLLHRAPPPPIPNPHVLPRNYEIYARCPPSGRALALGAMIPFVGALLFWLAMHACIMMRPDSHGTYVPPRSRAVSVDR